MSEIISVIALLCQLHTGVNEQFNMEKLEKRQKECHKYYAKCAGNSIHGAWKLSKCIEERK